METTLTIAESDGKITVQLTFDSDATVSVDLGLLAMGIVKKISTIRTWIGRTMIRRIEK